MEKIHRKDQLWLYEKYIRMNQHEDIPVIHKRKREKIQIDHIEIIYIILDVLKFMIPILLIYISVTMFF